MRLRLKKLGAIAVGLAMLAGVSACTSSGSSQDSANKNVTLQWGFWDQGAAGDKTYQQLADQVHKKYPNITVKLTQPPFADYFTKLQSQLAAGTTPCIVSMQSLRLPGFASALEPLGDLMKEQGFKTSDWDSGALKALQYNGEQYAIPYGLSTMILYYNKDAFAKAGLAEPKPGWTVADFEADAKKITEATGKPAFGQSFSDLHMFSMLYAKDGALPVTSKGKLDLTNSAMEKAFSWYSGLSTGQKTASTPASSADIPWGEQQFVAGNVSMAVDGTWDLVQNATTAKFNVGVVTLPVGSKGGGTLSANSGFGISKTCQYKKQAAQAISVIVGADASKTSAEQGNQPARSADQSVFFDAVAKQVDSKTPGFSAQAKEVLADSSKGATPFISTSNWDQTTKVIARQFILSYTGSQSPKQTLQNVQSQQGQ
ncbi:ABC transporter substrate-binding protein [Humibacter ginsenosidimutans]|nr:sugar ABC transporter substrate-binding protein [Humibacter ginsenosidimutans]